jgi:DNA-binding transcriptional LysR family regulator
MAEIDRILAFRDVVEAGGFSKAAERRGVVHSTLSRQVKELEQELGVTLMNRSTRAMSLTSAGEVVLRHGQLLDRSVQEMRNELERFEQGLAGELRIASLVHVGSALVMPAVQRFVAEHPQVKVRLSFSDAPLDFHRAGIDLALTVGLPDAAQLVVKKLCDNEVCIVAAPALIERLGEPSDPEALEGWPIAAYASDVATVVSWPYICKGDIRTLDVQPTLTVNDGVSLLDAARCGLGAAYVSRFSAESDLRTGRLVQLFPKVALPPYSPIYTVKSDLQLVSARIKAFEACLEDVVNARG